MLDLYRKIWKDVLVLIQTDLDTRIQACFAILKYANAGYCKFLVAKQIVRKQLVTELFLFTFFIPPGSLVYICINDYTYICNAD